jgi:hypothetical protein
VLMLGTLGREVESESDWETEKSVGCSLWVLTGYVL